VHVLSAGFVVVADRPANGALTQKAVSFNVPRLDLARYLSLAQELQLGADIIGTAIAPTWQQIARLGEIARIRTGRNCFLSREMQEEVTLVRQENETVEAQRGPGVSP
jgi:uncharacterized membrane protein